MTVVLVLVSFLVFIVVDYLLFVVRTRPGKSFFKLACLAAILFIPATVATTGSRGGLVTKIGRAHV